MTAFIITCVAIYAILSITRQAVAMRQQEDNWVHNIR